MLVVACAIAWLRERQQVAALQTIEARRARSIQGHAFELGLSLVAQARLAKTVSHQQACLELAESLLQVAEGPPRYVPFTGRPPRRWTDELNEAIANLKRDMARDRELLEAVRSIKLAVQAGDGQGCPSC